MRYAIVTETYPPEVNGVALTVQGLELGLRAAGHQVDRSTRGRALLRRRGGASQRQRGQGGNDCPATVIGGWLCHDANLRPPNTFLQRHNRISLISGAHQ